jgi:hypothetical protein
VQLQHLQEAGLLQPKDVQFAADLWAQPGYGLGEPYLQAVAQWQS